MLVQTIRLGSHVHIFVVWGRVEGLLICPLGFPAVFPSSSGACQLRGHRLFVCFPVGPARWVSACLRRGHPRFCVALWVAGIPRSHAKWSPEMDQSRQDHHTNGYQICSVTHVALFRGLSKKPLGAPVESVLLVSWTSRSSLS